LSTTDVGNELRDHAIALLKARGFNVQREVRVDIKKIDVLAEIEDELDRRRIAIECKNYSKNLSQGEVARIYTDHLALLQSKKIDGIWIITRLDFSPDARNWASQQMGLKLFTIADFEERQFGFGRYVRQIQELFTEQDLDQYYIQQRTSDSEFLLHKIKLWIEGDDSRPIAILGGYGMGKTSFCKYLVSNLAADYLNDTMKRVPIYIRLSEIAKEQELDGLLGKMLASRYRLANYNFQDVMSLNKRGKFVFIFDGFDEMKHALTWDLFKYNFGEINRTIGGDARVIIAGRPNAFLSDEEHSWALRGTRISGEKQMRLPDWPQYHELTIAPFSLSESQTFLRRYLTYDSKKRGELTQADERWIDSRIRDFDSLSERRDFARPVHLKIFADIATDRNVELKDFSIYELYDIATQQTIGREMEKAERLPISGVHRAKFVQDVAWWLWEKEGGRSLQFSPHEVPLSILRRVVSQDNAVGQELLREMFSGAFLERKFGENFYFSHRSFLEFFVAKKLEGASTEALTLGTVNSAINDEILYFIKSGPNFPKFVNYVVTSMSRYVGELKLSLLREIDGYMKATRYSRAELMKQQHVELLFKSLPLYEPSNEAEVLATFLKLVMEDLPTKAASGGMPERAQNAFYFILDAILFNLENGNFRDPIALVVKFLTSQIDTRYLSRTKAEESIPRLRLSRENIFEYVFLRSTSVAAESQQGKLPNLIIDFGKMFNEMAETRKPKIVVANRVAPIEPGRYLLVVPMDELDLTQGERENLASALRAMASARNT